MTKAEFIDKTEKIYKAIRKAYGYDGEADEIMDALDEMADAWEREH